MLDRSSCLAIVAVVWALCCIGVYNWLVDLDQAVDAQWAEVQNVYQRRADLIPNLVATVKGAAGFESSADEAVTEARASVGQVSPGGDQNAVNNPQEFASTRRRRTRSGRRRCRGCWWSSSATRISRRRGNFASYRRSSKGPRTACL